MRRRYIKNGVRVRPLSEDEVQELHRVIRKRTAAVRLAKRAFIILLSHQGWPLAHVANLARVSQPTARLWIGRFNATGLAGLQDQPRAGRPPTYTRDQVSEVVATALTDPRTLGQPFAGWTLDRLVAFLTEHRGIPLQRSRLSDLLVAEGLRWRTQETWFGERVDPAFAEKRGPSSSSTPRPLRAVS